MDHSKVTKGRTVHAKWTAFIFVQSWTYEFKYLDMFEVIIYFFVIYWHGWQTQFNSQSSIY